MPETANGANLLLGKGKVYFDRFTSAGVATGERFLGNCEKVEITTTDELREKHSSAEAASPLLKSVNVRRTTELSIQLGEFTKENVALALMGEVSALAQTAGGPVSAQEIEGVQQGCYYPVGKRKIKSVTVTGPSGTPTYDVDDDYTVDAVSGRIYIVEGGAITSGSDIEVTYSYDADSSPYVKGGVTNVIEGMLRFIGDPAAGPALEVEIWKVSITPDGAIALISDDFADFPLKGKVLADSVNHPDEPYYRVIQVSA